MRWLEYPHDAGIDRFLIPDSDLGFISRKFDSDIHLTSD